MRIRRGQPYLVAAGCLWIAAEFVLLATVANPSSHQQNNWQAPANVRTHVAAAGLDLLGKEGLAEHIHPHLTVTVNGTKVTVPAEIGIDTRAKPTTYAQIHTHDTSGIIHVESPTVEPFYLGQFFEEWGVPLTGDQVGPYMRGQAGVKISVFADKVLYHGNPEFLQLKNRQQVSIAVTTDGSTPSPAATFTYPKGY